MVTVSALESTRYTVDTATLIHRKGFIRGNVDEAFVVWLYTYSAAVIPGIPLLRGVTGVAADADICAETGANAEVAFGVAEFDEKQVKTAATAYASGDLIPVLPFAQNPGMIFQGWVIDTAGNKIPDTQYDAGVIGFDVADYANKGYAAQWQYVADIAAVAQHLILYALTGGHGG